MYKLPIVTFGIFVVAIASWFVFIFSSLPGEDPNQPSECGTSVFVHYSDVDRFNKNVITDLIKDTFSDRPDLNSEIGARQFWLDFVDVREPDEDGVGMIGLPGHWKEADISYRILEDLLVNLEYITVIEYGGAACS